jgi:hypothetical protein
MSVLMMVHSRIAYTLKETSSPGTHLDLNVAFAVSLFSQTLGTLATTEEGDFDLRSEAA